MSDLYLKFTDKTTEGKLHTFVNLYSYSILRNDSKTVLAIDNILIDGQLMVSVLKILRIASLHRKSFDMTSLAADVFSAAEATGKSVYLIGTTPSSIKLAVVNITKRFPKLIISGYHHGYLQGNEDSSKVIDKIVTNAPDLVVVGMGTPKQEQFLASLRASGWNGTGYTCGGFFHQTAANIDYYPKWADKHNLRWLYRIYDEPKLFKRYFLQYPWALLLIFSDLKLKPIFSKNKVNH